MRVYITFISIPLILLAIAEFKGPTIADAFHSSRDTLTTLPHVGMILLYLVIFTLLMAKYLRPMIQVWHNQQNGIISTQSERDRAMRHLNRMDRVVISFCVIGFNLGRVNELVGAAYLAVCSISGKVSDHASRMARSAREIVDFLIERNKGQVLQWKIRIGLHCGDIVGGIVGTKKYLYDIFGDTVNIASRMESLAGEMSICCTKKFCESAGPGFSFCDERLIDVKGAGEMTVCTLG